MSQIEHADFTPSAPNFKQLVLMNFQGLTNFPYIEEDFDALTNYGLLSKVVEYLNQVISNNNEQNDLMTGLYNAYVSLQNYINDYFDSLDVQEEINNKLDSMAQDGSLTALIKEYIDPIIERQDEEMNLFKQSINASIQVIDTKVDAATSGSPLAAADVSGMTNTSRIYVNTTDGNWYYYNGTQWTIGGQYQSAVINKDTPAIAEVYDTLYNELLNNTISISQELDMDAHNYIRIYYPFKQGNVYKISFISEGLSPTGSNIEVSTDTVPTPTIKYSGLTNNYFIFTQDASYIRFFINKNRVTSEVICSVVMENIDLNTGIKNEVIDMLDLRKENYNIITINDIENKTGNLFNDLEFSAGGVENNTTIYQIKATTSDVAEHSQVLKIRDENGNLYFDCSIEQKSGTAKYMNLYDVYGKYLTSIYYGGGQTKFSDLSSDVYYIVLIKYPTTLSYQRMLYYGYKGQNYHVGSNYDFTNLTQLLKSLSAINDKNEKNIFIHSGTYNLYDEYGGNDYFSNVDMTPSNWRNNCAVIPENTHIIGLGKVILNFEFPDDYKNNQVFSSINATRSCSVENLTINQYGGRYLVHFEMSGGQYDQTLTLKNCILNSTFTSTSIIIGTGISKGCKYNFENIVVNSTMQDSLYVHTNDHNGAFVNIKDCYFQRFIDLQNWASQSTYGNLSTRTNINNSYLERLILRSQYDGDTTSDFDVYSIGTNDYTVQKVRVTTNPTKKELII